MLCLNAFKKVFFVLGFVSFYILTLSESIGMDSQERDRTKSRTRFVTPKSSPRENPLSLLTNPREYSPRISKENVEQKQTLSQPNTPSSSPRRSPRSRCFSSSNPLSGELPSSLTIGADSQDRNKVNSRTRSITPQSSPTGRPVFRLEVPEGSLSSQTLQSPSRFPTPRSPLLQQTPQSLSQPNTPSSSPRRSPRPRCFSSSNPLSGQLPSSFGMAILRSVTPRTIRLNDYLEERLEEMGNPEHETVFDIWCKKFYQKFKGQKNESFEASISDWQKTTNKPLLDQVWKHSIMEYLTDDRIEKFDEKSLEVIGASVIFLIEELKDQTHSEFENLCNTTCTIYRHLSTKLSEKLKIMEEDITKEECFYHIAKHCTLMKSYAEAWPYLTQCADLLDWNDEEEQRWLIPLRDGYLSHLKIQLQGDGINEFSKIAGKEIFKIPGFLPTMKVQTAGTTTDNLLDCKTVNICLEGAKDFYQRNQLSEKKLEAISRLDASIRFPLACLSYQSARGAEEEDARTLLTVSRDCFLLLDRGILDYTFMPFIEELVESLGQEDPRSVKPLKAEIFAHMGQVAWDVNEKEKAKELLFEAAKSLYHTKPQLICPNWDSELLALILDKAIHSAPATIWERMVSGISMNLVKAQYKSRVYLTVLRSYMEKEMWMAASRLLGPVIEHTLVLDNDELMLQCLTLKINRGFEEVQAHKKRLFKGFSEMIEIITAHKKKPYGDIGNLVEGWIQDGLITKEQWSTLQSVNSFGLIIGYFKEVGNEKKTDFLTLELKPYADRIYDMFGLGEAPLSFFKGAS